MDASKTSQHEHVKGLGSQPSQVVLCRLWVDWTSHTLATDRKSRLVTRQKAGEFELTKATVRCDGWHCLRLRELPPMTQLALVRLQNAYTYVPHGGLCSMCVYSN